ncbi:hypothetical protein [Amycolatopsis sp. Hca4]|uniref:hypothetical protein n=1 Tax=Amycolatopsis sp. Hca4 TaxID=2742131 RepID=UPI0015910F30|nr:hypothetical protein [Amycolatopsis sp. Hca4]QKV74193.1 hypothetical protein HUT10_10770 [Amycolatopsis sp. Hca4]
MSDERAPGQLHLTGTSDDVMAPVRRQLPPDWRERQQEALQELKPTVGTGSVTVLLPGHRRPWSAVWGKTPHVEPGEYFDAETFREVVRWAFDRTNEVYLRERSGELTRLAPPGVQNT